MTEDDLFSGKLSCQLLQAVSHADGLGRCRVTARGARTSGGRRGRGAAEAPHIRGHAPGAGRRRKASGTQVRKGMGSHVVSGKDNTG